MIFKKEKIKKRLINGTLVVMGYILSPLSWWNDLFVNVPIAYLLAIPFGIINRGLFIPFIIFFYWCTNILGIMMMHYGTKNLIKNKKKSSFKKELLKMILWTTFYSILIMVLVLFGIIKFPTEYFNKYG